MIKVYQPVRLVQVLPSAVGIVLLGLLLSLWLDLNLTLLGRAGWAALPLGMLAGLLLYAMAYVLTCQGKFYTTSMRQLMRMLRDLFRNFSWAAILLVSILAGVGEELLIRGVVQFWLTEKLNPFWGIVLASLLFGFMHYLAPVYVLVTFVLGLFFGVLFYISDSLLLVMVAHAVYDILAFAVIVKYPRLLDLGSEH